MKYQVGDVFIFREYIPESDEDPFFLALMRPLYNTIGIVVSVIEHPTGHTSYVYYSQKEMRELQIPPNFITELISEV
jgi:hypothetical protein